MSPENVVAAARAAHFAYWRMTGDESAGDKLAAQVTRQWQQTVCSSDSSRFHAEAAVAPHLHERLDLVDTRDGVAYELKVSPNNAHFEFYRDVFKALVAQRYSIPQLKRLVFITPTDAAEKLLAGLAGQVIKGSLHLGLELEIVGL